MMNNNLLLYGSAARGDSTKFSDVDLLTIGNDISNKYVVNNINVSYYNNAKFREMAASGSLFIYHLNQEAKIIFDEGGILNDIIYKEFFLRPNYNEDIYFAVDLLNAIMHNYKKTLNFSFANSKIAWCLRTIYSGIGANNNKPLFSKKSIIEHFGNDSMEYLWIKKNSTNQTKLFPKILTHVNSFIDKTKDQNLHVRSDLQVFKKKVLNTMISNQYPYEFDY